MAARRSVLIAVACGVAAAAISAGVAIALAGTQRSVDGEFVLDEPGVYQQTTDDPNPTVAGAPLPDVELIDVAGAPVSLAAYAGRPLVVNLWYSACAPCARELRDFADVHADVGDRVQFVGVNPYDQRDRMLEFAGERDVAYDLLRDVDFEFVNELGVVAYPVTLFVDADGRIVGQTGEIDAAELRGTIDELFG